MINITKDDLKNFKEIGSGNFGIVYKVDNNCAYKIYRKYVHGQLGEKVDNPCLTESHLRLKRLKKRKNNIKNTDIFDEYIYIDGKFGGIRIPYYKGNTLNQIMYEPFDLKYDISKQLIENTLELIDNKIYPLDYKLNNIIYTNNKVKVLDLDDIFTKVTLCKNIIYKNSVINDLNETIRTYFCEFNYMPIKRNIEIERDKGKEKCKIDDIQNYLDNKNIKRDFIIINSKSELNYLINFLKINNFNVIYMLDNITDDEKYVLKNIYDINSQGIKLYDLINPDSIDDFLSNNNSNEVLELRNKQLIKHK